LTTRTRNNTTAALAIGLAAVFGLLTALIVFDFGPLYDLDHSVARWAYDADQDNPTAVRSLKLVAIVFAPLKLWLVLGAIAVVLAVRGGRRTVAWIVVTIAVSWCVSQNVANATRPHFVRSARPTTSVAPATKRRLI